VLCFILHARLRVRRAPGIPHALWGGWFSHDSGASRRETVESYLSVIARSDLSAVAQRAKAEATKQSSFYFALPIMDCFAPLAMTMSWLFEN
jgi:hypothetical protein